MGGNESEREGEGRGGPSEGEGRGEEGGEWESECAKEGERMGRKSDRGERGRGGETERDKEVGISESSLAKKRGRRGRLKTSLSAPDMAGLGCMATACNRPTL